MDGLEKEYLDYDPDMDFNGAQGIGLAERIFERYHDFAKIKLIMALNRLERSLNSNPK